MSNEVSIKKVNEVVVKLQLSEYLFNRMKIFCEANEISMSDLVLRCVQSCESHAYF